MTDIDFGVLFACTVNGSLMETFYHVPSP